MPWRWLWRFLLYSFLGFVLEVAFAQALRHPKKDRKCLLLLPLCPVYGLGAGLILYFTQLADPGPLLVAVVGFLSATAAEYLMAVFYERVLGVRFWSYARMPLNIQGRVCLPFSLCWGLLALALVYGIAPLTEPWLAGVPAELAPPALILLLSDILVSSAALRRTGRTDVLRWYQP